jgi:radical SAM protein with 4Fe4S-binding SPASM domain
MAAIRLFKERNLQLNLKAMALTLNEHEVLRLQDFVTNELGLPFRYDTMVNPRVDSSTLPLELRLPPRRVIDLEMQDPRKRADSLKFTEACIARHRSSEELYSCNAGITDFGIDPYGKLSICMWSTGNKFDLRRGTFSEGWEGPLLQDRSRRATRRTRCFDCSIREMCGMCPVSSELERGDPEEPVDYYCETAHLRAKALGVAIAPHGDCEFCPSR